MHLVLLAGSHLTCPRSYQFFSGPPPFLCTDESTRVRRVVPTGFRDQRSWVIAASTNAVISAANRVGGRTRPSTVCTRAAKVMLDTSQTPLRGKQIRRPQRAEVAVVALVAGDFEQCLLGGSPAGSDTTVAA